MGIATYIDAQLDPARIPDPEVDAALDGLATLRMDEASLLLVFDRPDRDARRFLDKERSAAMMSGDAPGPVAAEAAEEAARRIQARVAEIVTPARRPQRVLEELTQARVIRALASERQLEEVLVDFWMNHFNVFAGKDADRILVASFENEVIRPHLWGCFRDLLLATARSPAMLLYLDNAQSVADIEHRPGAVPVYSPASNPAARAGLNENYARELMELHTLGVDGGYTQLDGTELARILTGWAIAPPEEGGGFSFRPNLHDVCAKTFRSRDFPAGGYLSEGESAIDLLARDPATAQHIALELCRRFVADDPPRNLVDRVAARFLRTDGDLRETVRAIVTSPEFLDPTFFRAKIKSPFEFVISALRATGASAGTPAGAAAVAAQVSREGEPLYLCAPPTGYPERGSAWVGTEALLARWNFALALAGGRIPEAKPDFSRLLPPGASSAAARAIPFLERAILGDELSEGTRRQLTECVVEPDAGAPDGERSKIVFAAGVLLGSPEFQRR